MNGPQRTACLAKGFNNGNLTEWAKVTIEMETHPLHKWTVHWLQYCKNGLLDMTDTNQTGTICNSQSGRFTEPLPDNNVTSQLSLGAGHCQWGGITDNY